MVKSRKKFIAYFGRIFCLFTGIFTYFSQDTKTTTVALSEIKDQINQGKVDALSVSEDTVVADIKTITA